MVRADEIRTNAKIALDAFKSNNDYRWLKAHMDAIGPKDRKRICLDNVLWYAEGLEKAIHDDDLIAMRCKERYQTYLDSFARCRQDMEKIIAEQEPNLFSLSACARDFSNKTDGLGEHEHIFSVEFLEEELTETEDAEQTYSLTQSI